MTWRAVYGRHYSWGPAYDALATIIGSCNKKQRILIGESYGVEPGRHIARHDITPRFLSQIASYDVARNTCQALVRGQR